MMGQGEDVNDQILMSALKRQMKRRLDSENGGATPITQNFQMGGGGGGGGGGRGMLEGGEAPMDPREMQYFVDIVREELEPGDTYETPEGERKATRKGWRKMVHRFASPKKKADLSLGE